MTISLNTNPKLSLMNRLTPGYALRTACSNGIDSAEAVL